MKQLIDSSKATEEKLSLRPEFVDLLSAKVQMTLAGGLVLLICIFSWAPTLQVGFLLDDYLHLDYVSRAFHGDWHDFLANFSSNWAGSDIMRSYRPLVSLSIFADYLVWGANAWGYHLSNLLMLFGCSLCTGLITLELSGLTGNRLRASAAIWTMLLFAVYPLHLEAAAWVIGRVDLLCTLFYLLSVFYYLRFKIIRERIYFHFSLISFVVAVLCKEMAYTLPVVITAMEFLLQPLSHERQVPQYRESTRLGRLTGILTFWFLAMMMLSFRLFALHELVGGYGKDKINIAHVIKNFCNPESISRILFPVNLDLLSRDGTQSGWDLRAQLEKILKGCYAIISATAALRILGSSASWRIPLFLLFWIAVGVLPTFQVWNISPNLVGSRLFFVSSAPFAILLSFLALPAIDAAKPRIIKPLSVLGSIMLLAITGIWSYWLQFDMKAWTGAAESLKIFKERTLAALERVSPQKSILILNLPRDYSGAGMLTRARYLRFLMQPPVTLKDYSRRIQTIDPGDPQGTVAKATGTTPAGNPPAVTDSAAIPAKNPPAAKNLAEAETGFSYANELKRILQDPAIDSVFIWQDASASSDMGFLSTWQGGRQSARDNQKLPVDQCKFISGDGILAAADHININDLKTLPMSESNAWTVEESGGRLFQRSGSGLRIKPGSSDLVLFFPVTELSPLKTTIAELKAQVISGAAPEARLLWSADQQAGTAAKRFYCSPISIQKDRAILNLGTNTNWVFRPVVRMLALGLPAGDYEIEISGIELR